MNALKPMSSTSPISTTVSAAPISQVAVPGGEISRELAGELQADNDELRETNRQLIAAMEEIQSLNVTLQSVNEALHATNVELRSARDDARTRASDLEHVLNGIGIATVLLNDGLEVRDYNATASRFFALTKQDLGRPLARIRHDLADLAVVELCREALASGEALERIGTTAGGALVSVRVRELEVGAESLGLMLTVTEITDLGLEPASQILT
jgi:nitrogen fixation/metabolism regulation signal transduction histidine kinase